MSTKMYENPILEAPVTEPKNLVTKEYWEEQFTDTIADIPETLDSANGVVI